MKKDYWSLQFVKNIRIKQWVLFFVHLSVWLMLFGFFSLFSFGRNESLFVFMIFLYFFGIILFYLNYFFLTPRLLLQKKYLIFSISILIIVLVSLLAIHPVIHQLSINDFMRNSPSKFINTSTFDMFQSNWSGKYDFFLSAFSPWMFLFLFSFLTFSSLVRVFQKLKSEEAINLVYKHEQQYAELKLLRQQVSPHFLFNSLNNIHSLANRKSDQTSEAIIKLSAILRYMLSENPNNEIPVTREITLIENYIDLQKLWLKNAIKVDFVVKNVNENYCIEPFILNPLVENAFKYGSILGTTPVISIYIEMISNWLYVKITNTVMPEILSSSGSTGIGVNNVVRRLELCYQGNYKFENNLIGEIYQINLSMKLKNNELHSN